MSRFAFLYLSLNIIFVSVLFENPSLAGVLDNYDPLWNTQSANAAESMPLGGGDVGLNVWVEDGQLLFYIGQSGTFDENNHMLKLGRMRIDISPDPFEKNAEFLQHLKLKQGLIHIKGNKTKSNIDADIKMWVEIHRPVIHVEIKTSVDARVTAQYENWRTKDRDIPADCRKSRYPCMSLVGYPGKVTMYADDVDFENNTILFYHRNRDDDLLFEKEIAQQELEAIKDLVWNPLKGRTFGGLIKADNMSPAGTETGRYIYTDYTAYKLTSDKPAKFHHIKIYLNTSQTDTVKQWRDRLDNTITRADAGYKKSWKAQQKFWAKLWDKSYLYINPQNTDPDNIGWQIGKNYQLFRYMLACNAYGKWPTKFNGSFFTFDPALVKSKRGVKTETPDFRTWGGGSFTAQNQRLVYWPMLYNGDFDFMKAQFDFYKNALPAAQLRTKVYWGHQGCSFTEQLENFGLPIGSTYGWTGGVCRWGNRDPKTETGIQSLAVSYQYGHQLDFSFMILEYQRFSGRDISEYIPFIDSSVRFFDEHYRYRNKLLTGRELDDNGKLVIYPSRGCETYVDAKNPADVIAGLQAVLGRLLELPDTLITTDSKKYYRQFLDTLSPLPIKHKDGKPYLAGAEEYRKFAVGEIPELYCVFPYNLYSVARQNIELPLYTWNSCLNDRRQKDINAPWYQGPIFTARLGLTGEAEELAKHKLKDTGEKFSAFKHSDDWTPDHNWMGAAAKGLQEMLMQTADDKIYLFPAWPAHWDVDFKFHAPYNTIIECSYKAGKITKLNVSPAKRKQDIRIMIR